ncbi:hypothetical protein QBC46DRAFT_419304 [Diplogelasinospora grovesii]|uniref:Uncharacterized protein n=1 Tax=Diplogelasinospora grovesii TaxID=303347 RepID=A0AAN6S1J7_9PEZI|nr:hypothetical protein QBC46DRAFT_419304 [Diplogelasinospora grovesii]
MSWTRLSEPYRAFTTEAHLNTTPALPFVLRIWERDAAHPNGVWVNELNGITDPGYLNNNPCELRIIFAPLDLPQKANYEIFVRLFTNLAVPSTFVTERVKSVCHSFGSQRDPHGTCTWFHFLCKNISVTQSQNVPISHPNSAPPVAAGGRPEIRYHPEADTVMLELGNIPHPNPARAIPLPQADYSYLRSGFFLRVSPKGDITLVCFGTTEGVWNRFNELFRLPDRSWVDDVKAEPHILFDIILDGLFMDVDQNVWNVNKTFGPLEHDMLSTAFARRRLSTGAAAFVGLHNFAKHVFHLGEALHSCISVSDAILAHIKTSDAAPREQQQSTDDPSLNRTGSSDSDVTLTSQPHEARRRQLRECILLRQSLFRSTQLRLNSLEKRVGNAITLSFNLLTQQDSLLMIRDSNSMKVIAGITVLFLPTAVVASIVGSQMFTSSPTDAGGWSVAMTLFPVMWYVAIPLTVLVLLGAWILQQSGTRDHHGGEKKGQFTLVRKQTFTSIVRAFTERTRTG